MKEKITLTVKKHIIEIAKRQAKEKGISLSQIFEEIFESRLETDAQKAAEKLLNRLDKVESISQLEDKELIKTYVARKFA
jgi:hypothetical protein